MSKFWIICFNLSFLFSTVILEDDFALKQHDYQVKFERIESVSYNKEYVEQFKIITFKYNRTCTAFNGTLKMNIDPGTDLEGVSQAYRFASNEYRLFPLRFQLNVCDAFSKNVAGLGTINKCGNLTGCPLIKGRNYHVCNFIPDPSRFPPLIPNGRYMLEEQVSHLSKEVLVMRAYLEIFRPFIGK